VIRRAAALADVHGNAAALAAVLDDVRAAGVDLVVSCGDLLWGPFPRETLELVRSLETPVRFVRGNADRTLLEGDEPRAQWLREQLRGVEIPPFEDTAVVEVEGLGRVCFAHGSPRSDEECVTVRTPEARVREFMQGVDADVVVTGHTHIRYERAVNGWRLLCPGSVGVPYGEPRGAYWALLGSDVEYRRSAYDVDAAVERIAPLDDPGKGRTIELLLTPPDPETVIAYAEERVYAG
jgi:putative phosphoesterase